MKRSHIEVCTMTFYISVETESPLSKWWHINSKIQNELPI